MPAPAFRLRPMTPADLPAALDMWQAAWQAAYPAIDFAARRNWAAAHLAELERGGAQCFVALAEDRIAGGIVVDPRTGYIDQLVVAVEHQGRGLAGLLLAQARSLSPARLELHVNQDNARALRLYRRHGFAVSGEDVNPHSGAPVFRMRWQPDGAQAPSNCSRASRA